jgi:hypothetical protein
LSFYKIKACTYAKHLKTLKDIKNDVDCKF